MSPHCGSLQYDRQHHVSELVVGPTVVAFGTGLPEAVVTLDGLWWLLALVAVFVVTLWTGRRLSRVEGGALLGSEVVRWVLGVG